MQFKIDTKDTFSVIIPVSEVFDAKMADALKEKCNQIGQSGRKNFIIDLGECDTLDKGVVNELVVLHEEIYGTEQSLVFTGLNKQMVAALKENETDLLINYAPTMKEAIDIVSMEILERDLFNEE